MIYSIWLVNQWKCAMLGKPKQHEFFQLGSTARLPRLPGRATRISFQDVPGFCVINSTNIGIDPKQGQQETKGKKLALACINMRKNCTHIDFLSQCTCKQRCKAVTYQRAVHSSLVAVAVRKLFKSLRYTNIVGWRNPHHFNNSISRSTNLNLHTAGGGFDWISFSAILEVPFQPLWEASFGATHSVSHSWNIPESLKQNENWLGPVLGHRCYCTLKQLVRVTKSHDDQSWCQILEISHTKPPRKSQLVS